MAEKNGIIGGFAAENNKSGSITDCYCLTSFKGKKMISGGFVGKNEGNISTSYSQFLASKPTGGFSGQEGKPVTNCYFVIEDCDEKNKEVTNLWDSKLAKLASEMQKPSMVKAFGFDLDKTWITEVDFPALKFKNDNWFYNVDNQNLSGRKFISIKTADELRNFAGQVNEGNKETRDAYVKLEADIDLKGKKWIPIGEDRNNGFTGIFDGNGHNISGLLIKGDDLSKKGCFGFLMGSVYNLELDCMIKGDGTVGGIAAVNEGIIGCCGVTIQFEGKGDDFCLGGLVGSNEGTIFKSFASGDIKIAGIPIIPLLILLCAILLAIALVIWVSKLKIQDSYKEIPSDPDQHKYTDDILTEEADTETGTTLSFNFMEYISIDRESGQCYLDFQNPPETNCKIVIQLVMDEDVAKEAFEGNSWNNEYYDSSTKQVIIAESGAVEPGYQLDCLYLNEIARSNLHTGQYTGNILLVPYDEDTEDLKPVNATLPVTIEIQ